MAGRPDKPDTGPLQQDAFDDLGALGLASSAAAYQHILLNDDWSLDDLAGILGSDQAATDALDHLVTRGLIVPSQEASDTLRPVAPRAGLTPLIREQEAQIRRHQDKLEKARSAAERLMSLYDEQDNRRRAELEQVFGRDQVTDRIADLIQHAETEVCTLLALLPDPAALAHARRGDEALLERGVQTRVIVLAGHLRRSREYGDHLRALTAKGAEVRVVTAISTRMIIVDRRAAIVPSDPDNPAAGATLIHQPGLIRLTLDAFEAAWERGSLLDDPTSPRTDEWEPTELEREVIRLLGAGNKDEAVARRIGLSLRSVRRIITNISEQLGADSRFALGVCCRRRNLV